MGNIMKSIFAAVTALLLVISTSVMAQEGFYVGPSLSYFNLDSKRVVSGHDESGVLGLNLGYKLANDWAIEAGYGSDIAADDLDVAQINAYRYLGEDDGGWRPYLLAGLSYFDREGESNLQNHEEYTTQAQIGAGLAKMLTDHWEFRGDVRMLHKISGGNEGVNDAAVNFALNYYFNDPAPAPAPVVAEPVKPAPAPAPEPETRTITVKLHVEFETDKDIVRAIYGDELNAVANAMKVHEDITLVLEGHTDSRASDSYNQDLSERRAKAVKAKIVEDYGIDASRISAVGYGESRPVADNGTVEGRARNRRVVGEMTYTEVVD
jgi:OOP family OmpA-OmpF porin